ncbi:hypothetical protein HanPSC8_Chr03g0083821 [Helianthus annuus]|nr:hypothetical protein HanIR_Chr12g0611281 [Helianthus annuus]KAJ0941752.1 hypothetical protein HanPSC8_Chr03g0083821 [Helianthus annuus]
MQQERKQNRTHAVHSARARSASCVVGIAVSKEIRNKQVREFESERIKQERVRSIWFTSER